MRIILLLLILLSCSCTSQDARKNQSIAAANIYHAALAIEQGASISVITPRIKSQALLIIETNKDTLKGVDHGN